MSGCGVSGCVVDVEGDSCLTVSLCASVSEASEASK